MNMALLLWTSRRDLVRAVAVAQAHLRGRPHYRGGGCYCSTPEKVASSRQPPPTFGAENMRATRFVVTS